MRHFRQVFRNNFRPEVANDVVSGEAVELVGVDVRVKFGDSRSNRYRYIRAAHFVIDDEQTPNERRRRRRTQVIA